MSKVVRSLKWVVPGLGLIAAGVATVFYFQKPDARIYGIPESDMLSLAKNVTLSNAFFYAEEKWRLPQPKSIQPSNKDVPCVLASDYGLERSSIQWVGGCRDGLASGLGRVFAQDKAGNDVVLYAIQEVWNESGAKKEMNAVLFGTYGKQGDGFLANIQSDTVVWVKNEDAAEHSIHVLAYSNIKVPVYTHYLTNPDGSYSNNVELPVTSVLWAEHYEKNYKQVLTAFAVGTVYETDTGDGVLHPYAKMNDVAMNWDEFQARLPAEVDFASIREFTSTNMTSAIMIELGVGPRAKNGAFSIITDYNQKHCADATSLVRDGDEFASVISCDLMPLNTIPAHYIY